MLLSLEQARIAADVIQATSWTLMGTVLIVTIHAKPAATALLLDV